MKTYAPSATKRCAVARPIPLLPPVMTATFPASLLMNSLLIDFLFLAAGTDDLQLIETQLCHNQHLRVPGWRTDRLGNAASKPASFAEKKNAKSAAPAKA